MSVEPMPLSSLSNPRVKSAMQLRRRAAREEAGLFLVEGEREIERALQAGFQLRECFVDAGHEAARGWARRTFPAGMPTPTAAPATHSGERRIPLVAPIFVTDRVFEKLAVREGAEGAIATFAIPECAMSSWTLPENPLVVALVGIEKPGNLGGIARSCDAFGVHGLVVAGGTDLWNPNAVRASVGALFSLQLAVAEPTQLLTELKSRGLALAAATPRGGIAPDEADFTRSTAILLGSEEAGLPPEFLDACEMRLAIPMLGASDSLNVSVTAGVLLYEAARQRRFARTP